MRRLQLRLPEAAALLVCGAALVALTGWRFEMAALLPEMFGLRPMPPDSAALFLLCGASLLVGSQWRSHLLTTVSGLLLCGSGVNILLSYFTGAPYWLGEMLYLFIGMPPATAVSAVAGSGTGFGFCILGLALIVQKRCDKVLANLIVAIGGILVISLGSLRLLMLWFGMPELSGDLFSVRIADLSGEAALLFCLLGFVICAMAKRDTERAGRERIATIVFANQLLFSSTLMILFIGVNRLLSLGLEESTNQKAEVARTYRMEKAVSETVAGVREAESGQRGYLLTGRDIFLDAYRCGLRRVASAGSREGSEPGQPSGELEALVQLKLAELAETVILNQAGRRGHALAVVVTGRCLELMRKIEAQAATSHSRFILLIGTQNSAYKRAIKLVRRTVIASYVLGLCLFACAALFFRREIRTRIAIEARLRAHEEELALGVRAKTIELEASEARYRAMLDQSPLAIHVLDSEGNSMHVNASFERMVGVSAKAMQGYNIWEDPQPSAQGTRELLQRTFAGERAMTGIVRHVPKLSAGTPLGVNSDEITWAEVIAYPVKGPDGSVQEVVLLCQDVTDREQAVLELRESEAKFRQLADVVPQVVWTANPTGVIDYLNERWWALTQSSPEQGMAWEQVVHPHDRTKCVAEWTKAVETGAPYELEVRLMDSTSGEYRWFLARAVPIFDELGSLRRWVGTTTDIQDRKAAEENLERRVSARTAELIRSNTLLQSREDELRRSLSERDILFREVHHRVKNNLQVISSLLRMKSESLRSEPAASIALEESRRRVLSMSMIHERLYTHVHLDNIDFADYTKSLVDDLIYSYSLPGCHVTSRVQVQPIRLQVDQAIPCGLILNELVTNALKYAFPGRSSGEIAVVLRSSAECEIRLSVSDNGVGLPAGIDWRTLKSLGLPIVNILARQLDGTVDYLQQNGATFVIRFRDASERCRSAEGVLQ